MYKHKQCLVSNKVFKEFSLMNLYRIFMDGWGPARLVWALRRRITSRWRVKRATSAWYISLSRLPCGPNVCPSSCSDRGNLYNVNCIVAVNLFRDKIFSCCKIFSCDFRFYYEIIKLIFWLCLFSEDVKLVGNYLLDIITLIEYCKAVTFSEGKCRHWKLKCWILRI